MVNRKYSDRLICDVLKGVPGKEKREQNEEAGVLGTGGSRLPGEQ